MLKADNVKHWIIIQEITAASSTELEKQRFFRTQKVAEGFPKIWESDLRGAGVTQLVLAHLGTHNEVGSCTLRRHNEVALGDTKRIWRIK